MLNIGIKTDYGFIFLVYLATHKGNDFISLKEIAKKRNLSANYLAQLAVSLKNAGIIESREGKSGGYRFAKKLKDVSLAEIIKACEGQIATTPCIRKKGICKNKGKCLASDVWAQMQEDFEK
ncbi:hypothetical protein A2335_04980, partial [Candidatus Peregrinibacteria bacterium RIFOXYB2_FULL_32_7]